MDEGRGKRTGQRAFSEDLSVLEWAYFIPGEVWKDTDGNPINAHGGGLLYHDGAYYWYGEYKKGKTILRYYDADGYLTQGKR